MHHAAMRDMSVCRVLKREVLKSTVALLVLLS